MYTSNLEVIGLGLDADEVNDILSVRAPAPITYAFKNEDSLDSEIPQSADLVIAKVDGTSEGIGLDGALDALADRISKLPDSTRSIAIIPHSAAMSDGISKLYDHLDDIWYSPMSHAEMTRRFSSLLDGEKARLDAWETSQYLETTINSIPSLVWYKTKDGIHEKVNDAFCKTVNKPKDIVQGQRHAFIWDVETDDPACIESEEIVMSTGRTCVAEEQVKTGDGSDQLLTTYKSPLYDPDGEVMGTVGVAIDITQERAYELSLLDKNAALETIFTSMECGIITHSLDGEKVIGINQAALDILGYETEDDLVSDGFHMIANSVLEEDKPKIRELIDTLHEVGDSVNLEYRVRHKDGSIYHVMGNVKIIEKDGEPYYQRFILDVTEQKIEEEREARWQRSLLNALSENYLMVCYFDIDSGEGKTIRLNVNPERKLDQIFTESLNLSDMVRQYNGITVIEEDSEMLSRALSKENILEELEHKSRFSVLYRVEYDGTVKYSQATVVKVGSWSNDADRYFVIGFSNVDQQTRDEMERNRLLEDALANANRASEAKSTFLSNMSHDIRTPMNAVIGFTTLAKNHITQQDRVEEYLDKIQASSAHLLHLINDILDMSHIESGKVSLDEQCWNLKEIIENLRTLLQSELEAHKLDMVIDTDGINDEYIICDKLKLNQILLNLLGNAVKFTPPKGQIKIDVAELADPVPNMSKYRITIEDSGIGMSKEFLEHIFDPFERERNSTISGIQGTGLGMAITKNLVDMMNGEIEVESEQGEGTKFTITLPFELANAEDAAEQELDGSESSPSGNLQGSRILLVEDNMMNREIATTLLEDVGIDVETAENGQLALELLQEVEPDRYKLILMDIQMPIMDGYETAKAIRNLNNQKVASLPILAVTANAFEEDKQRALESGMNGHIPKPITVDALLKALDSIL